MEGGLAKQKILIPTSLFVFIIEKENSWIYDL
jgi:hypothetical protein